METIFALKSARHLNSPIATIGVFDGVHRGHQTVLAETLQWARQTAGTSIVITFDRHPETLLKGSPPDSITSLEHKLHLVSQTGIDVCLVLHFDRELVDMEAEDFAQQVLVEALGTSGVVLGYNCRFGRGGRGNARLLGELGGRLGFDVRTVAPLVIDGAPVSSTRIRGLIEAGDLEKASVLLGRPVTLRGTIVHGTGRGRKLGFPTANLNLHHEATPPAGVYICRALAEGETLWGLVNIGVNPTFAEKGRKQRKCVEVYIDGYSGTSLYGRTVEVEMAQYLRPEAAFDSPEALAAQIEKDRQVLQARKAGAPPLGNA
ncbi:MAG: riboflavin biosynthesis protein RibF [Planctomycetes bacterium]|nr:riboflavin biosynthesis protein RibF [Planctomycetota bacterium]